MSLFAAALSLDADEHAEDCTRWIRVDADDPDQRWDMLSAAGRYRIDDTRPCSCRAGPLRYDGSHLLPTVDGPRAGSVALCEIPDCAGDPDTDDEDAVLPFLRLWVCDGQGGGDEYDGCPVLLDRQQVGQVHAYLGRWLARTGEAQ